jgi:hypothetical protein
MSGALWRLGWVVAAAVTVVSVPATGQDAAPKLTVAEKEQFLLKAKVGKAKSAARGITGTSRATLSNGTLTHEASIQSIDEYKPRFESPGGTEINFKDTYKFNIAGYKLSRMLGIPMVPPSVPRKHNGTMSSFTWWVDDVLMEELDRMKKKVEPPDQEDWNHQMHVVRVFDQLIYNMDRNLGNLVIDKQWRIWMIDHSRAFRMYEQLKEVKNLQKCEKTLFGNLKGLTEEECKRELKDWLSPLEIQGMLKRRDKIVAHFEQAGPSALYSYSYRHD